MGDRGWKNAKMEVQKTLHLSQGGIVPVTNCEGGPYDFTLRLWKASVFLLSAKIVHHP